ncbi:MAG: ankyrin repeat domain-containing protein [Candidatus Poribacteria bacterium]
MSADKPTDIERQIVRAAGVGDIDLVQTMLTENPELLHARGLDGSTPLHMAVWKGKTPVVRLLLDAGADVNVHNNNTHWGTTPLHAAAHSGRKGISEMLIEGGTDITAKTPDGITPLATTNAHKATSVANLLRKHGATE